MAVFIKITETFTLSNSKDKDLAPEFKKPIVAKFKKIKADTLSLTLCDNYKVRVVLASSAECKIK